MKSQCFDHLLEISVYLNDHDVVMVKDGEMVVAMVMVVVKDEDCVLDLSSTTLY